MTIFFFFVFLSQDDVNIRFFFFFYVYSRKIGYAVRSCNIIFLFLSSCYILRGVRGTLALPLNYLILVIRPVLRQHTANALGVKSAEALRGTIKVAQALRAIAVQNGTLLKLPRASSVVSTQRAVETRLYGYIIHSCRVVDNANRSLQQKRDQERERGDVRKTSTDFFLLKIKKILIATPVWSVEPKKLVKKEIKMPSKNGCFNGGEKKVNK